MDKRRRISGGRRRSTKAGRSGGGFFSAGRVTTIDDDGKVNYNEAALTRLAQARAAKRAAAISKTAGMFGDGELGPANIADSNNIGYYSFQFPVDAMEMPASRAEELEFYRIAVSRDPIVARAIDLHTELPLSKMRLEKAKCSVESFSDYVFDYFQRLMNDTKMFSTLIKATREYQVIGEAFMFVEQPEDYMELELCNATKKALTKGRGYQSSASPMTEATNAPMSQGSVLPDFITKRMKASSLEMKNKIHKAASDMADAGILIPDEKLDESILEIKNKLARLNKIQEAREANLRATAERIIAAADQMNKSKNASLSKFAKLAKLDINQDSGLVFRLYNNLVKTAAPGDDDAPTSTEAPGAGDAPEPDAGDAPAPGADAGDAPDTGAEDNGPDNYDPMEGTKFVGPDSHEGDADADMPGGDLGADLGGPSGGFGGFGGHTIPHDRVGDVSSAIQTVGDNKRTREIAELKRYVHLLERKKELMDELVELKEKQVMEKEIFSHVVNPNYEGFERIQILQPERITLSNESGGEPTIVYKPSDTEKALYLNDPEVPDNVKDELEDTGVIELNQDPFKGSYCIHFARKQSGYEEHGRSVLQPCLRSIIYREKLRQVQTTLASRNMTPKTLVTAPGVPETQIAQLRAHVDEAKADPDYTIVTNYEVNWNEIDAQSRMLNLADEWQHTNSNLAIGLGFSPEILIGEGMYGGNRIQVDIMAVTYTQFREELSDIIENQIFKPIAMLKGFYELDKYGRPRWIYPKVSFGQLSLRDSGDLYDMMYNLYAKGSLPISSIYEFLGFDEETVTRQLENDLFSVRDSKFNELLSNIYSSVGQKIVDDTDLAKRLTKNMKLTEEEVDPNAIEGSGEGM